MKVMNKPDVQRVVTRFRREPNNYLLEKKLRTIIWRKKKSCILCITFQKIWEKLVKEELGILLQ